MAWFEEEEEVAEEEVEGVERAVVMGVVMTFLGIVAVLWLEVLVGFPMHSSLISISLFPVFALCFPSPVISQSQVS